jgi:hypothetical protein
MHAREAESIPTNDAAKKKQNSNSQLVFSYCLSHNSSVHKALSECASEEQTSKVPMSGAFLEPTARATIAPGTSDA